MEFDSNLTPHLPVKFFISNASANSILNSLTMLHIIGIATPWLSISPGEFDLLINFVVCACFVWLLFNCCCSSSSFFQIFTATFSSW